MKLRTFAGAAALMLFAAVVVLGVAYLLPTAPAVKLPATSAGADQSGIITVSECLQLPAEKAADIPACRKLFGGGDPKKPTDLLPTVAAVNTTAGGSGLACNQARDLGPWAPDANWNGHNFEVTASDQAGNAGSSGVVLGLWWTHGKTDWENKEITTFIPRGLSIEVVNGAGRGWDYEPGCAQSLINEEMRAHMSQRKKDTSYYDYVQIDELIKKGLVKVRFDRRTGVSKVPTASPTFGAGGQNSPAPQGGGGCTGVRQDRDPVLGVAFKFNPSGAIVIINGWSNQTSTDQGAFKLLLGVNDNPELYIGGAYWTYPAGCATAAAAEYAKNKLPERTLETLKKQGYVK